MLGAVSEVADTLAEDSWSGAQWDTGKWLESCTVAGKCNPFVVFAPKKGGYNGSSWVFDVVNPTRCFWSNGQYRQP